jgi:hypothetical protein
MLGLFQEEKETTPPIIRASVLVLGGVMPNCLEMISKKKVLRSCARCHRYKNTNPCASSPPNHLEPYHHGKDIAIRFQRYLIELIPELIGPFLLQIRIWCYLIAIYERSRHWYQITARSCLLVTRHHEHSRGSDTWIHGGGARCLVEATIFNQSFSKGVSLVLNPCI